VTAVSFGPLILSASIAVALARLVAHGLGTRVLLPLVVAIVVADLVTALAVRLRMNVLLAVVAGGAASLWALLAVVDPGLLNPGSPHFLHGATLGTQLRTAHGAIDRDGTPLPLLNGVVLVIGAIGAGAAILTRSVWARAGHGYARGGHGPLLPALAPSLAIFTYSTLVSAERGRVAALVSYFIGVTVFVVLADRAAPAGSPAASPGTVPGRGRGAPAHRFARVPGALAGCLLAVLVVIGAGAGLSGMRLTVFHVTPPPKSKTSTGPLAPGGTPQNLVTGLTLVDHLLATEITESKVVIFRAQSPVTTYWAVGTLSSFNGTEWLPVPGVSGALSGSAAAQAASLGPAALPTPSPSQTFVARVAITDFASRLLPAPPDAIAVHGLAGAAAVGEEGVLASTASTSGTTYTVTAGLTTAVPAAGRQLASTDPRLAPYLALPAQPAVVAQLARQAVGSATTPVAKAQALVDWFRSGRFRYTLSPPATSGPDPLVQFLTVTKAGYCAQFAGAYGVLARDVGIPTRLVVGFTPGRAGPGDTFTVTGADAHVWPQVYLGPDIGWTSVEPTPPVAGTPVAPGVMGAASSPPPSRRSTTGTTAASATTPTATPTSTAGSVPAGTTPTGTGNRHGSTTHRAKSVRGGVAWWAVMAAVLAGLLLLGGAAVWIVRRRRSVRQASLQPGQRVVRAWEHALAGLRRAGVAHRVEETPAEYVVRVRAAEQASAQRLEADAVADLAALVEQACYAGRPCTPGQAAQAWTLASTIVAANRSHRRRAKPPARRE
jgi:transglutaminase-like putative cysteine protease